MTVKSTRIYGEAKKTWNPYVGCLHDCNQIKMKEMLEKKIFWLTEEDIKYFDPLGSTLDLCTEDRHGYCSRSGYCIKWRTILDKELGHEDGFNIAAEYMRKCRPFRLSRDKLGSKNGRTI